MKEKKKKGGNKTKFTVRASAVCNKKYIYTMSD